MGPARQPHCLADAWDPADPGRGPALTVDLVNVDQVNANVMMTSASADLVLTSAGHLALPGAATCQPVCFSFSENLYLILEIVLSIKN